MAYPTIYKVTYSYTGFQQSQGNNAFPGTQLDSDLAGLQSSVSHLAMFVSGVIRSDGKLNNGSVNYDSLSPNLQMNGIAPADPWRAGREYRIGTSVVQNSGLYRCLKDHASGVFADDLAAGLWLFIVGVVFSDTTPLDFDTIAGLADAFVSPATNFVRIGGYYSGGDGGEHTRVRDDTGDVASADGATWKVADTLQNIRMHGARGNGTDDGPAIRRATAATPKGGRMDIPFGDFYVNSVGADGSVFGLAADTVISIMGYGWSLKKDGAYSKPTGSVIRLGPDIPDTADVIRFFGTDVNFGSTLKDFAIVANGGTLGTPVGRHGIFVDASDNDDFYQSNLIVDHVFVDNMKTGYSFKSTARVGSHTGGLAFSIIGGKSQLMCVDLAYVGDGVEVSKCILGFNATNDARNIGVRFNNVTGAAGTQVIGNVIANFYAHVVCEGGVHPIITGNELEMGDFVCGQGALIDMTGATSFIYGGNVTGNSISQNSTKGNYIPIRIGQSAGIDVHGNRIGIPRSYAHIVLAAGAGATHIGPNYYSVAGATQLEGTITDSGQYNRVDGCLYTIYPGQILGATILRANSSVAATGVVELPNTATTDTIVARNTADTLTNKTLNAASNAISGLTVAAFAASVVDTDGTLAANSDTRVPSQKAVKTYAGQLIAAADAMVFKGVVDCSINPNYPAADKGWTYKVSVAGKIGGASGTNVDVGDILLCIVDGTAAGTQTAVGANWSIAQANLDLATATPLVAAGAGAVGSSVKVAREDHVHPIDAGQYPGTTTNDNASAGNVGEYVENVRAFGSALSLTSMVAKTIASITLTAGDWDVTAIGAFLPTATTNLTRMGTSISTTTDAMGAPETTMLLVFAPYVPNAYAQSYGVPPIRFSLSVTTTIYMVSVADFTVSTIAAYGRIHARRIR